MQYPWHCWYFLYRTHILHPDIFSFWHITPHLWWNLINWWEVPRYHSCCVANAVTPSPHAKTKDHCIMPPLYQGAGAKIVTVINRIKNLMSCFGMKRIPKSLPCKQGTTAFIFAYCSRLQKVYFRPGPGYKIKESAAKKELNPMISLPSHIPGSTTNESIWEEKSQWAILHSRAWLVHLAVPGVLSAKPGCPVIAVLIIVFIPLKTTWLGAELNWFLNNVYPFSSPPSRQPINGIKD